MKEMRLSPQAEADLEDAFYFGLVRFGEKKTEAYLAELEKTLDLLARFPFMAPAFEQFSGSPRIHHHRRHSIIYFVRDDHIWVARVVRDGTDIFEMIKRLD